MPRPSASTPAGSGLFSAVTWAGTARPSSGSRVAGPAERYALRRAGDAPVEGDDRPRVREDDGGAEIHLAAVPVGGWIDRAVALQAQCQQLAAPVVGVELGLINLAQGIQRDRVGRHRRGRGRGQDQYEGAVERPLQAQRIGDLEEIVRNGIRARAAGGVVQGVPFERLVGPGQAEAVGDGTAFPEAAVFGSIVKRIFQRVGAAGRADVENPCRGGRRLRSCYIPLARPMWGGCRCS